LLAGAVKFTVAVPLVTVTEVMLGAPGTVTVDAGVTAVEEADAAPDPAASFAVTVNV
jgi:hypothetical protein